MTTYCEVPLEGFGSPVVVVSADFAVVVDVESVEFVEPVWDWLEEGKKKHPLAKVLADKHQKSINISR